MTTTEAMNTPSTPTTPAALPDPRPDLATVVASVRSIIEGIDNSQLSAATPCDDFDVHDLLDHIELVFRRVAAIGNGNHWSSVEVERVGTSVDDYATAVAAGAHAMMDAWTDASKLEQIVEVPWASLPATAALFVYVGELAIHTWDLATATAQTTVIPDDSLRGALFAWKQFPSNGRTSPDIPFDEAVDPGPGAPLLLQLVGWSGRQVR